MQGEERKKGRKFDWESTQTKKEKEEREGGQGEKVADVEGRERARWRKKDRGQEEK